MDEELIPPSNGTDYGVFRFSYPDNHTRSVHVSWIVDLKTCYYPLLESESKINKFLSNKVKPFEGGEWEAYDGCLLKKNLSLSEAKERAEEDKRREYSGNLTSDLEGKPRSRKRKTYSDFDMDSPEQSRLKKAPKSPTVHLNTGPQGSSKVKTSNAHVRVLFVEGGDKNVNGTQHSEFVNRPGTSTDNYHTNNNKQPKSRFQSDPEEYRPTLKNTPDFPGDVHDTAEAVQECIMKALETTDEAAIHSIEKTLNNSGEGSDGSEITASQLSRSGSFLVSPSKENEASSQKGSDASFGDMHFKTASKGATKKSLKELTRDMSKSDFREQVIYSLNKLHGDNKIILRALKYLLADCTGNVQKKSTEEHVENEFEITKVDNIQDVHKLEVDLADNSTMKKWVTNVAQEVSSLCQTGEGSAAVGRKVVNHIFTTNGKLTLCMAGRKSSKFKLEGSKICDAIFKVMRKLGHRNSSMNRRAVQLVLYKANDPNTRKKASPKKKKMKGITDGELSEGSPLPCRNIKRSKQAPLPEKVVEEEKSNYEISSSEDSD